MVLANSERVAVVYMLSSPGGVQSCVLALIRGLNARGIVPDVLWDEEPSSRLMEEAGARAGFVRLPFRIATRTIERMPDTLRYLAWIANVVDGELFRGRYDCFFTFYNGFLIPKGKPHLYYLCGPPLLPQLETTPAGVRGAPIRAFRWLYLRGLKRCWPAYEYHRECRYVIISEYTSALFRKAHGVSLPIVHPPIDLSGRSFEPSDLAHRDTLLFFSRIVNYKRPELVLELARRHPSFRCVIMGGSTPNRRGYLEHLQREASRLEVSAVFLPNPSRTTVLQELTRARFYIFPAIGEHFGMTTPEAIVSGAIPFVHDSGGQREIVPDERLRFDDGTMFEKFGQVAALSDGCLQEVRAQLRAWVEQFSTGHFVAQMLYYAGLDLT
jgi:glycosyltransferase involved in cell wall biosynthesis